MEIIYFITLIILRHRKGAVCCEYFHFTKVCLQKLICAIYKS